MQFKTTRLSDKAMQVKLGIKRPALVKRSDALTQQLQQAQSDEGLTVSTKIFRVKGSPIARIMAAVGEVYAYHRKHTLPYQDGGYRLLPSGLYFTYTSEIRHLIAVAEGMLQTHMPNYDWLVQDDIAARNLGRTTSSASTDDYPSREKFEAAMSFDLKFSPLPDESHPLFDLSDADRASFQDQLQQVVATAHNDVVSRMLEPLTHLGKRLTEYKGEPGQRFHVANVENVVEGCRLARSLAIDPSQELLDTINELERVTVGWALASDLLKNSESAREAAVEKINDAAKKLGDYFL